MKKKSTSILACLACILTCILIASGMLTLTACSSGDSSKKPDSAATSNENGKTEAASPDGNADSATDDKEANADFTAGQTVTDPSGAEVTIPKQVDSIVVLAPALSEIVTALDLGDKVVGYDTYSAGIEGLPKDAPTFDTTNPDMEKLSALDPDMLLTSNLTLYDQDSPYQPLVDAGTCVICVPSGDDFSGIKSDIRFLASALGVSKAGDTLLEDFDAQLNELSKIADSIPDNERKSVYFEIAPAPNMYSFGNGVYMNEMIEWIGAKNILSDKQGWITVEGETVVAANPDAIFTNVSYVDDPVQEILSRDGWAGISAIADKNVHYIDNNASSQANHNIVKAMRQMAELLYPDYYKSK